VYTQKVNSEIDRPVQELKAFAKTVRLQPEAVDSLFIRIPVKELRYWNEEADGWTLEKGMYRINAGASSRDIRKRAEVDL
jgi:beta-glucosidase